MTIIIGDESAVDDSFALRSVLRRSMWRTTVWIIMPKQTKRKFYCGGISTTSIHIQLFSHSVADALAAMACFKEIVWTDLDKFKLFSDKIRVTNSNQIRKISNQFKEV